MTSIHQRLSFAYMMAPGRKPREHRMEITREIWRLQDRIEALALLEHTTPKASVAILAHAQSERLQARREALLRGRPRAPMGRPRIRPLASLAPNE